MGFTLNGDQAVAGPVIELRRIFNTGFALGLPLVIGVGDDYITFRPSLQAKYYARFGEFWLNPTVGGSVQFYAPVGGFATYCRKYGIQCGGVAGGLELGGGFGYRWFGAEAAGGLFGLPVLTAKATFTMAIGGG